MSFIGRMENQRNKDELFNRAVELLSELDGFLDLFEGEHERELSQRINALLNDVSSLEYDELLTAYNDFTESEYDNKPITKEEMLKQDELGLMFTTINNDENTCQLSYDIKSQQLRSYIDDKVMTEENMTIHELTTLLDESWCFDDMFCDYFSAYDNE